MKSKISFRRGRVNVILIVTFLLFTACESKGIEREQYENGNDKIVAETTNGKPHGKTVEYYESGIIKNIRHYENGFLHGESKWFDEHGNVDAIQNIAHNKLNGEATLFYPNGNIAAISNFLNDKSHGPFVKFYTNGNKKVEGTMKLGKPVGEVNSYDSLGNVLSRCVYDSLGVKQGCQYYNPAGK